MHRKLSLIEFVGGIALLVAAIVVVRRQRARRTIQIEIPNDVSDQLPNEALETIKNGLFLPDVPGRVAVITINITHMNTSAPLLNV